MSVSIETWFSISFNKHRDEKKENNLFVLIIKTQIIFARAIFTSTARASSVFVIDQSARVLFPKDKT